VRTATQIYAAGTDEHHLLTDDIRSYHDGPTSTPMTQRRSPWSDGQNISGDRPPGIVAREVLTPKGNPGSGASRVNLVEVVSEVVDHV
jgi:hypothetical protein